MRRRFSVRDRRAAALILIASCAAALWLTWRERAAARAEAEAAAAAHEQALEDAIQAQQLRAGREVVAERARPEPDLIARLERSLEEAGLPREALTRVATRPPEPISDNPYARQRARATLEDVRPAEAARMLAAWRRAEPLWTVRSITLEHAGPRQSRQARDPEEQFTARLILENVHLAEQ